MSLPALALLAGGKATRLGALAQDKPKSLIEIAGHPFLHHQLKLLASQGIRDVVACLGHLGEQIQAYAGDGSAWGLKIRYSLDGVKPAGTGGALKRALPLLPDPFFVLYGDSYLEMDLEPVVRALDPGSDAVMTVFRNEGRFDASNVAFEGGRVARYEKGLSDPALRHIDHGLGLLRKKALLDEPGEAFDLAAVYGRLVRQGRLAGLEVSRRFYEIGSEKGIEETAQHLQGT